MPPEPNRLSHLFKLCRAVRNFPGCWDHDWIFLEQSKHAHGCQSWSYVFFPLSEELQPDYNSVANVVKPPATRELRAKNCRPFWSVMIPSCNPRADYLGETLWSVIKQDLDPDQMQMEVIDDASPNGTPTEFIRKIAGERIKVHCEPHNFGLAGIWNRCIFAHTG